VPRFVATIYFASGFADPQLKYSSKTAQCKLCWFVFCLVSGFSSGYSRFARHRLNCCRLTTNTGLQAFRECRAGGLFLLVTKKPLLSMKLQLESKGFV
jgi:hypothetical protein